MSVGRGVPLTRRKDSYAAYAEKSCNETMEKSQKKPRPPLKVVPVNERIPPHPWLFSRPQHQHGRDAYELSRNGQTVTVGGDLAKEREGDKKSNSITISVNDNDNVSGDDENTRMRDDLPITKLFKTDQGDALPPGSSILQYHKQRGIRAFIDALVTGFLWSYLVWWIWLGAAFLLLQSDYLSDYLPFFCRATEWIIMNIPIIKNLDCTFSGFVWACFVLYWAQLFLWRPQDKTGWPETVCRFILMNPYFWLRSGR
jgi:hypothetical protein